MYIIDDNIHSNAVIIQLKTAVVKVFLKDWAILFGILRKNFSDNGDEFINDKFYDM